MSSEFLSPAELHVPQWAIINRTVTCWDVVYDTDRVEISRTRTDFTGATIYLAVRDVNDVEVIKKSTLVLAEAELKSQVVPATKGQAIIKFVEADTSPLTVGAVYWFDSWVVHSDGTEEPITDRGRFHVDASEVRVSTW